MTNGLQLGGVALRRMAMAVAALCVVSGTLAGQSTAQRNSVPHSAPQPEAAAPQMPAVQGTQLDRAVAIVNGDLILDSDVDQERRFTELLPYGETARTYSRDQAIQRLINRDLILQQTRLQPENEVTPEAAAKDLGALRKELPTCKEFHCETAEGWNKFLASKGFTEESVLVLWQQRMDVLAFIEQRFRMGIKITPQQIQDYYSKSMLPLYAEQHVEPPPMASISSRIQEVLLQQQVSSLLNDWLKSLRAQGSVVVLHPGEGAP